MFETNIVVIMLLLVLSFIGILVAIERDTFVGAIIPVFLCFMCVKTSTYYFTSYPEVETTQKEVYIVTGKTKNLSTGVISYHLVSKKESKKRTIDSFNNDLKKNTEVVCIKEKSVTKDWLFTVKHPVKETWEQHNVE